VDAIKSPVLSGFLCHLASECDSVFRFYRAYIARLKCDECAELVHGVALPVSRCVLVLQSRLHHLKI
jgi:hypothetical protein